MNRDRKVKRKEKKKRKKKTEFGVWRKKLGIWENRASGGALLGRARNADDDAARDRKKEKDKWKTVAERVVDVFWTGLHFPGSYW